MNSQPFIDLMKMVLTDFHRSSSNDYKPLAGNYSSLKFKGLKALNNFLKTKGFEICRRIEYKKELREVGKDWPIHADTMVGLKRLENIEFCVKEVLKEGIEGDFIETGVWRGGSVIFMKAILRALDEDNRVIWVADSFEGLPVPDEKKYEADKGDKHYRHTELAVSLEQVKWNFEKYGLLDANVRFLKGWFKDTLPVAPIEKLSILRLDGDLYESTMDALTSLYPKLAKGGYLIVDDWGAVEGCKKAVLDYRKANGVVEEIVPIDWAGVYWKKLK
jgi:O-methyltransferase